MEIFALGQRMSIGMAELEIRMGRGEDEGIDEFGGRICLLV